MPSAGHFRRRFANFQRQRAPAGPCNSGFRTDTPRNENKSALKKGVPFFCARATPATNEDVSGGAQLLASCGAPLAHAQPLRSERAPFGARGRRADATSSLSRHSSFCPWKLDKKFVSHVVSSLQVLAFTFFLLEGRHTSGWSTVWPGKTCSLKLSALRMYVYECRYKLRDSYYRLRFLSTKTSGTERTECVLVFTSSLFTPCVGPPPFHPTRAEKIRRQVIIFDAPVDRGVLAKPTVVKFSIVDFWPTVCVAID